MKITMFAPFAGTLALAATMVVSLSAAKADVLYLSPQASSNYANNQIGFATCCGFEPGGVVSGAFDVGSTITLAGSGASSYLGAFDLFGYAGGGSLPIEVSLYAGANPNTGSLLGSAKVTPTGNGWTTEVVNFGHLQVPKTLTYIVSIVGNNGSYDDSFVNWQQFTGVTGSPTVGSSGNMWYGLPGHFVADNNYAVNTGAQTNTLAVQINSVSVPGPIAGAGLPVLLAFLGGVIVNRRRTRDTVAM